MPGLLAVGLVSTRNPYRPVGGPPLHTAGAPRRWTRMATSTSTRALSEESQFARNHSEPKPRKGLSHAKRRTDHETRGPDGGIACSQRDRAQNPVNTTRTCNKLRPVYWFTGEVR